MPTNECQHTNRDGSESAGIRQSCLHDDCLSVSVGYPQKLPNKPLEQGSILPSYRTYLATPSCLLAAPSPPRGAPTTADRRCSSASLWASRETASSC